MYRQIYPKSQKFGKCADQFSKKTKNNEKRTVKFIKTCKISENMLTNFPKI